MTISLSIKDIDPISKQREQIQTAVAKATPDQLGKMQEMLRLLGVGNISQASA